MGNTLFAYNNYVLSGGITATSQSMPVANVQDERGSSSIAWQTASGVRDATVTITPPYPRASWRAFGAFRTNLTTGATMTVSLWNSAGPTLIWMSSVDGIEPGFGQMITIADGDMAADYCTINFQDPSNADTFLNIPLIYAGPAWVPLTGLAYDTTYGYDETTDEPIARGGQEYPSLRWDRRRAEISMVGIRAGEVLNQLAEMQGVARRGTNVLMVPDVTSETINVEAIYGRLRATADVGYPYGATDRRSWRARITERL